MPANRASISDAASREVARQKIEARKTSGAAPCEPANFPTGRLEAPCVHLASPDAIPVDDAVGACNLATEVEPASDGAGAGCPEKTRR